MKITLSTESINKLSADLLAVGVRGAKGDKLFAALDKTMGGSLTEYAKSEDFSGKRGQTLKVPAKGSMAAKWVLLVGLGKDTNASEAGRLVGTRAARACKKHKSVSVILKERGADVVKGAAEGLIGGNYVYGEYKTGTRKKPRSLARASIVIDKRNAAIKKALTEAVAIAESSNLARDLVNAPPNDLNPLSLAKIAAAEAKKLGLKCTVWNKAQIKKQKMNLFLAVNSGSAMEPRMIHIVYKPKAAKKKVCFVGKGLTFDSGGLCLKPAKSMLDMKCDMAGAATTLGIVLAAARMKLPVEVHAVIGSTDNMTGADAYRPGDIIKSREGKTVEVINTDAEGRMVLADVLSWAKDTIKPDIMVDHATLTGACMVALGPYRSALYATTDGTANHYLAAADSEGENYWRMPLDKGLRSMLDSHLADLKHTGTSYGGSITAALFLKEFVGDIDWIHCDIAGPAFQDRTLGRYPKGGTGFGVATGARFLARLGAAKK